MDSSHIQAILRIPELAGIMCQYLSQPEIGRVLVTNRVVYCQLEPYFWRHIRMGRVLPHNVPSFQQGLRYARSITLTHNAPDEAVKILVGRVCSSPTAAAFRPQTCTLIEQPTTTSVTRPITIGRDTPMCSNLKWLTIRTECRSAVEDLIRLFHHNSSLMHVELCSGLLHMAEEKISERFAEAVSGLRHLRHFTMRDVDLTASATLAIMRATFPLPHLRELHLAFPILPAESEDPVQLKDVGPMTESILEQAVAIKTAEGTITTKITALSIPSTQDEFGVSFLLPFLKSKLFDLDTLQIPATDLHLRGRALEDALRKYCPKVKHLRCQPFCIEDYKDITNACAVIRGCTGLQSYHAESIDDEVNTRPIIDTLLEHHAKTLEAYEDLRGYSPLKSKHLKSMLCSCKNLRRVWVEPGIWSYALEFGQILSKEWVCLRMKELSLCLDRYDAKEAEMLKFTNTMRQQRYRDGRLPSVDGNPVSDDAHYWGRCYYSSEVDKWAAKRVYAQIGKLVVLEVLALKVHEFSTPGFITERFTWDLTLKDGYLRELGGLRKLRHFHMASNFWLNMGQAEVEFMHEQWPALCEISFDLCHIRADTVKKEDEFQNLVGQPHWRWFLEKRPTLHYANRTLWGEM